MRSDETTCPFCDGTIPPCTGACASTTSGEGRIGYRAAIVFATAAAAVGACGKERDPDPVTVQPYGAPPIFVDAAAPPQTSQTQTQPPIDAAAAPVAVYGPPPINKKDK